MNQSSRNGLLILMRGLPGSGKSTLAKSVLAELLELLSSSSIPTPDTPHATADKNAIDPAHMIQSLAIKETPTTPRGAILSTDDFFVNDHGEYLFDSKLLESAHRWNQGRAVRAMAIEKLSLVIIDNTNVTKWEMRPYVKAAQDLNFQVQIMEPKTTWWIQRDLQMMVEKNTHQVPLPALERMASRWEYVTSVDEIMVEENNRKDWRGSSRGSRPPYGSSSPSSHSRQIRPMGDFQGRR